MGTDKQQGHGERARREPGQAWPPGRARLVDTFTSQEHRMPSRDPELSRAVIAYANACKDPADRAALAAARSALDTARIAALIRRTLADAPPLPAEHRAYLTSLLATGGAS